MSLASIYSARGKHDMAEPLLQQVLEWRESWVKSHIVQKDPKGVSESWVCIVFFPFFDLW